MKGYKFTLHNRIWHNGSFIGTVPRTATINAHSEVEALKLLYIKPDVCLEVDANLTIETKEHIYEMEYIGKMVVETVVRYEK